MKKKHRKRSTIGLEAVQEAKIQAQLSDGATGGVSASSAIVSKQLAEKGGEFLTLDKPLDIAAGNEALPPETEEFQEDEIFGIRETLKSGANFINLDASIERMKLVADLNCLDMAVDAAQSIDAKNSLEKMLIHQAAVCHAVSMDLLRRAQERNCQRYKHIEKDKKNTEIQAKLISAAGRLMDIYDRKLRTFQKLRNGGRQVVTVQHVQVDGKAQAIITGSVDLGRSKGGGPGGGENKKEKTTSRKVDP